MTGNRPSWLPPAPTHKRCSKCSGWIPVEDFPTDKTAKDFLSSWCRSCHAQANRAWRAKRHAIYDERHPDA